MKSPCLLILFFFRNFTSNNKSVAAIFRNSFTEDSIQWSTQLIRSMQHLLLGLRADCRKLLVLSGNYSITFAILLKSLLEIERSIIFETNWLSNSPSFLPNASCNFSQRLLEPKTIFTCTRSNVACL